MSSSTSIRRTLAADPDQVRGIESAIEILKKLGAEVRTIQVSPLSLWTDCNRTIHASEAYAIHERDLQERPEDFAMLTRNRILAGAFVSSAKYIKAQQLRRALCKEMAEATRGLDAVITLSSLLLPCKIDDTPEVLKTYDQQCRLVFNVTGTPAISVPTGLSKSGMPLAVQIAAHAFRRARRLSNRARLLRGGGHDHHRRSQDAAEACCCATHCGGGVAPSSSSIPLSSPAKAGDPVLPVSQFGYDGED